MKRSLAVLTLGLIVIFTLSACIPLAGVPGNQVSDAYIKTAVAGTMAAEKAREAGAALSYTATPDGTPAPEEGTPEGEGEEATPEAEEGTGEPEDPEPAPENPWMLQSWCVEHMDGCVLYDLSNRTDSWLQVELRESETGVTGFFTVRSKTVGRITLIPGYYQVKYTWWCDGEASSFTTNKAIGSWIDVFKCPQGFYQRLNKE